MKPQPGINTYWIVSCVIMGLIFLISSFPPPEDLPLPVFPLADKLYHMLEYGLLASFIYLAREKSRARMYPILIPFLIAFLYGISDEIHQYFVPGRQADVFDALADGAGGFLFPLGIHAIRHRSTVNSSGGKL
jgi:VanZ family protein